MGALEKRISTDTDNETHSQSVCCTPSTMGMGLRRHSVTYIIAPSLFSTFHFQHLPVFIGARDSVVG
jgi:hypothetical protein